MLSRLKSALCAALGSCPLLRAAAVVAITFGTATAAELPAAGPGPLDGMVFAGLIGPEADQDFDEELLFNDGLMWSKTCVPCGYQPSVYWVRRVGDAIHFTSELKSASGSLFHYEGVVDGERAEVAVTWTKSRWYWTIDRDLMFKGTLVPDRNPGTAAEASRIADQASLGPLPDWCQ